MSRLPRNVVVAIQLLVSAAFVVELVRRTDLARVGDHIASADATILVLSLLTKLAGFTLIAARLRTLSTGSIGLDFRESFRAQSIAFVGNNVLPLRLGEALKIGFMSRLSTGPLVSCVGIAALERILDSLFLVLFILAALVLFADVIETTLALYLFVAVALAAFAGVFVLARWPDAILRLAARVTGFLGESIRSLLQTHLAQLAQGVGALASPRLLGTSLGITGGYWVFSALSIQLWLVACGIEVPWYAALVVLVFVSLATVLPAAPGFVGTYHYFAVLALGLFDVDRDLATSFAIIGHATAIVPFTLLLTPLVGRDIVSLHRSGPPRIEKAARRFLPAETRDAQSAADGSGQSAPLG